MSGLRHKDTLQAQVMGTGSESYISSRRLAMSFLARLGTKVTDAEQNNGAVKSCVVEMCALPWREVFTTTAITIAQRGVR